MKNLFALAAVAPFAFAVAHAQTPAAMPAPSPAPATAAAAPPAEAPAAPAVCCKAPAGMPILLEITERLGSKFNHQGDKFTFRLSMPIVVDGKVLVPAGTTGVGEVIDAAKAGFMGKPGELMLAARYLDYNGARIKLRGLRLGGQGNDNADLTMVLSMAVGIPALFVQGGEINIPVGARAEAKLAADLILPPASDQPAAAAAAPAPVAAPVAAATPTSAPAAVAAAPSPTHP